MQHDNRVEHRDMRRNRDFRGTFNRGNRDDRRFRREFREPRRENCVLRIGGNCVAR